jgi:hypothetical protein
MSSETASGNKVIALALNGNETLLIGLTDTLQLMCFSLTETQPASAVKVKNEFSVFSYPFHHGSITGVDVCQRKPLGNHQLCLIKKRALIINLGIILADKSVFKHKKKRVTGLKQSCLEPKTCLTSFAHTVSFIILVLKFNKFKLNQKFIQSL